MPKQSAHDAHICDWQRRRNELVTRNLGIVGRVVGQMSARAIADCGSFDDAFQLGCIGLIRAVEHWEPERLSAKTGRPVAFSSYAWKCIWSYLYAQIPHQLMLRWPTSIMKRARKEDRTLPAVTSAESDKIAEALLSGLIAPEPEPVNDELTEVVKLLSKLDRQTLAERFTEGLLLNVIGRRHGVTKSAAAARVKGAVRRLRARMAHAQE